MGNSDVLKSDVFERSRSVGAPLGASAYNLLIGLVLCWGFAVNWMIVRHVDPGMLQAIPMWQFLLGYFGSCFLGVYLFNSSHQPPVSFLGYNLVVVPFGLIVNMVVSRYDPALVLEAIRITGLVTVVMMGLGTAFPRFFERIGTALFLSLLAVIVIELYHAFVLGVRRGWTDWAVVLIFCGYIGYDWGRANRIPKTVDNAVDSAAAIYMDVINLFLRVLRLLGRRR
jgi:FtsH-binding integral membrane protein